MVTRFVPLRILSAYTMLEGAIDPKVVVGRAKALGFPAAAITDRNGLYGAMAFSDAAKKAGVQPIIAALLGVARPAGARTDQDSGRTTRLDWLALYAQDEDGYNNLCALVSAAHLDRPAHEDAHVPIEALEGRTDGLIALTAGAEGALARLLADEQQGEAERYLDRLQALFPDRLYIEISRRGDSIEERAEEALIDLAYARDLPLVATNPAAFPEADFHPAHDAMLCIANSAYLVAEDRIHSSPEAWIKPADMMAELFADLPEAIANTAVVAQRCAVAAPSRKPILPSLAGDREAEEQALRDDAAAGLEARLDKVEMPEAERIAYRERLAFEVNVIVQMGFPGYFLIVADFIKWAKDQGIPVGPGRGSGAGSVVAWALTITDLDPLQLGLLFERFLNPERVSMPDFDIDFCETRRGEVINYVQRKYGRGQVAQIITFGRLKARAVLKDTGRVLQMSYGQVDRLAKLVPNHPTDPWTLDRALNGVSELHAEVNSDKQVRHLFDLAMKLEGLPRHSSTHAAGVVIGDRPLDQLVPLYRDPRSDMPVTQFDMKYVEGAGLVKFDFLGLKTLSVLQKAIEMLANKAVTLDLLALELDDPAVYQLLQKGDTVGVFQLESEGMRRTLAAVRPTNFGDIIALVSLYRPGPMDNIPMFGDRKNGRADIQYPHPLLETILSETYGIFVYQEQVMQAAQILAGYSLGQADLLRRAMGKKVKAEMDAQRAGFVEGCLAINAIEAGKANELFDLIDKFAGYGFNKSHAAAYALLAYQTAWLKAHHKPEFFAASMCYDLSLTDKLAIWVDDTRRSGVELLPPDINHAQAEFSVEDGAVRYALGALKGVGEKAMEQLVEERASGGAFRSLDDFADRIDPRLINRRQLESLAAAGAFDTMVPDRAAVFAAAETILAEAAKANEQRETGQGGLFGGLSGGDDAPHAHIRLSADARWTMPEKMGAEKEAFGFYFSAHPTDRFRFAAQAEGARTYAQVLTMNVPLEVERDERGRPGERPKARIAALIEDARWRTSARGNRYLMATCSDSTGQFILSAFDEGAGNAMEAAARAGECLLLHVELDRRPGEETPRLAVRATQPLDARATSLRLRMEIDVLDMVGLPALAQLLADAHEGRSEIDLLIKAGGEDVRMRIGTDFRVDAELASSVERLPGMGEVRLDRLVGADAIAPPPKLYVVR
jgi:DNA polymerase-3 subunit alpha